MQAEAHILYGRRAIYYLSKTFADQLQSGDDYSKLSTTIGIHFLDFRYFPDERVLRQFVLKDTQTHHAPSELSCVRLYFVEMPKFDRDWPEVRSALDRWVAFLNRAGELDRSALPAPLAGEPVVVRAIAALDRIGSDPEERAIYEGELKKRMIDAVQLRSAEERGLQQGLQQGLDNKRHLVLRQLERRLGEAPASVATRVQSLSLESLDDLGLDLLDFTSYADAERWLESREAATLH